MGAGTALFRTRYGAQASTRTTTTTPTDGAHVRAIVLPILCAIAFLKSFLDLSKWRNGTTNMRTCQRQRQTRQRQIIESGQHPLMTCPQVMKMRASLQNREWIKRGVLLGFAGLYAGFAFKSAVLDELAGPFFHLFGTEEKREVRMKSQVNAPAKKGKIPPHAAGNREIEDD